MKQTEEKSSWLLWEFAVCLFFSIRLPNLSFSKTTKAVSIDKKHCVSPAESPSVSFPQQAVLSLSLYSYPGFHKSKCLESFIDVYLTPRGLALTGDFSSEEQ